MRLADFIRGNVPAIVADWQTYAESLPPAAGMTKLQLKNHIEYILDFIADDIETCQSGAEQFEKSIGHGPRLSKAETAAESHGALRADHGFDIVEMVSEYRALRASIVKLWVQSNPDLLKHDLPELTRFNESIDQALAESVVQFTKHVDEGRDLLLGVLGHDIRNPVAAIQMAAGMLEKAGPVNERQKQLIKQIEASATRVSGIVIDLLDLAKSRHGSGLPLTLAPTDLKKVAQRIAEEARVQHPDRHIEFDCEGDLTGNWDELRLGQVISNLLGNAIQYGDEDKQITVSLEGTQNGATIEVHNFGTPIPPAHQQNIFKSFTRGPGGASPETTGNLGLGLFIAKEIALGHGGKIDVTSDAKEGTRFSVSLPKNDLSAARPPQ